MSEQPRKPAQGSDPVRPDRTRPHGDQDGTFPTGGAPREQALHPWQQGSAAPARGVPAEDFQRPGTGGERPVARTGNGPSEPHETSPPNPAGPAGPGHQPAAAQQDDPQRLGARPTQRPDVDPAQARTFGRPSGVSGSFHPDASRRPGSGVEQAPPPPDALTKAFGRPQGTPDSLQREPGETPPATTTEQPATFWNDRGDRDPWRNPSASSVIGPPALPEEAAEPDAEPGPGPLLSAREVLFGRRVRPRSLAALAGVAVLLAGVGGFVGRITAEEGNPLTNPDVTLAEVEPGMERPSGGVAGVAHRIVPAVVSVEVHVGAQGGSGSGVVIDGNGYIVTNNHVVSMAADTPGARVSTVFSDGSRVPARIVGRDVKTDLAVIKVEVANPTVAQLGRSADLAVGDQVIAVGSPLGLASTVTTGIVSSVNRPVRLAGEGTDTNAVVDAIQTDAAINPGNSGGALVDGNGAVVGINSGIRTIGSGGEGGSIGLGFAIPIDDVRRISQELIRGGRAVHADLGVNAKSVNDGTTDGAQVLNVRDNGSAAAAGIAEGDVIIRVGDRKVSTADELVVAVDRYPVGRTVPVTVVRQGRELVLDVALR
ncbi:trypsin-like peptidase domain-containing protein [Saccharopolyspora gloriosae]|uniref:S1-C subfamily serine protease n=1 Tax=Saccharopolyspora gloriosae TaxID=455344 RepID=A0A840N722_9PSEU|nr:trypsin-like peptidase domain-containing protein [Saccharopolyspora gloriosae]MBB5067444.1 S1-C subfamily serine protease [Saccharopolyspora gloriosae]